MRRVPLIAVLLAVACQPAQEMAPARTMADVDAAMQSMRDQWAAGAAEDDAATVASFYTDDAVFVDVYGIVYSGKAAIEGYFVESFAAAGPPTIEIAGSVMSGDGVAAYGTFSQMVQGPEGEMAMAGNWQTFSVFQADGSLKIRMHTSAMPAEPPPAMPEM